MKRLIAGGLISVTIVLVAVAITRHVSHKQAVHHNQAVQWCHENGYAHYATTDGFCVGAGGKLVKVGVEAGPNRDF